MSNNDPYSPPKAVLQDAVVPSNLERRLLRDLVRMFDNEPARMALIRRLAWAFLMVGAIAMTVGLWAANGARPDAFWPTVLAIFGGYAAGLSNFFFTSIRQWPIVRRYLDVERIRADYKSLGG